MAVRAIASGPAPSCAFAAFSGRNLVKGRRTRSVQLPPISSWTVMVKDELGHVAAAASASLSLSAGSGRSIPSGSASGRPISPMIAASTLASISTSSPRLICCAMKMRAPEIALGARVDGQDVVDAGRRAEVDLHAPHHPDDLLAMLAVGELGVVDAGQPQDSRSGRARGIRDSARDRRRRRNRCRRSRRAP